MKLTVKQLIQTICDLTDGNFEPCDIQRETGWNIEKCKELSEIAKACIGGEVEVEEINKIGKVYDYANMGYVSFDKTKHIHDYDKGMYRGFFLVRQRMDDEFPEFKNRVDNQE